MSVLNDSDELKIIAEEVEETIFKIIEDAKSFAAKLALVKKFHLRGISVFRLGIEDAGIWPVLGTVQNKSN